MSDIGAEHEGGYNMAAEAAEGRAERKKWGPKFWKRLGIGAAALLGVALLPTIMPAVGAWLAAPLVAAGVPGLAAGGATGIAAATGLSAAGLSAEAVALVGSTGFLAKWLALPVGLAGAAGLLSAIRPGAKYATALGK